MDAYLKLILAHPITWSYRQLGATECGCWELRILEEQVELLTAEPCLQPQLPQPLSYTNYVVGYLCFFELTLTWDLILFGDRDQEDRSRDWRDTKK